MSMKISEAEIDELRKKYHYLVNYESDDPGAPIDPVTYVDSNGDTLLHIASQNGDLRTIEVLLKAGMNVNQIGDMGSTPLHYAENDDVANFLLAHGASKSISNEFGELPRIP